MKISHVISLLVIIVKITEGVIQKSNESQWERVQINDYPYIFWDRVKEHYYYYQREVEVEPIVIYKDDLVMKTSFVYYIYNKNSHQLTLHLAQAAFIEFFDGNDRHSLLSNARIDKTRDMTIHHSEYIRIHLAIFHWLKEHMEELSYIDSIECFENILKTNDNLFLVKAILANKEYSRKIVIEKKKDKCNGYIIILSVKSN